MAKGAAPQPWGSHVYLHDAEEVCLVVNGVIHVSIHVGEDGGWEEIPMWWEGGGWKYTVSEEVGYVLCVIVIHTHTTNIYERSG